MVGRITNGAISATSREYMIAIIAGIEVVEATSDLMKANIAHKEAVPGLDTNIHLTSIALIPPSLSFVYCYYFFFSMFDDSV